MDGPRAGLRRNWVVLLLVFLGVPGLVFLAFAVFYAVTMSTFG